MKQELILNYTKSTPGTHVYKNNDVNVSFYLPKAMSGGNKPEQIKLTIETAD